ncbi:MAG: 3-deoxy-manno-octulosonate cytidylyltransferase [Elusimicrobiota bacterium]
MRFKDVIGVIPARYASSRFPGKPLAMIKNKPMIEWVYRQAKKALLQVVVATDDVRIIKAVHTFGGVAMMTPRSCASGTDRMAYVAQRMKATYFVNIQGDEPLIDPGVIRKTVILAKQHKAIATSATYLEEKDFKNINTVKVVIDKQSKALYFSRALIPFPREGKKVTKSFKHQGLYVYPREELLKFVRFPVCELESIEKLEQLRALYNGLSIYVNITAKDSLGVDTPADLRKVASLMK